MLNTLWEALGNLATIEMVDLEKIKMKIETIINEISNLSPDSPEKLLKNVSLTQTEIELLEKILKEIQFNIKTHLLNFELIQSGKMRTRCFEDILRPYGPTNISTKIKLLFSSISFKE